MGSRFPGVGASLCAGAAHGQRPQCAGDLWKLNDGKARDFMVAFYKIWLSQARSDPAKALRDTQLSWLKQDARRDPRIWAPYVVVE